jgi:hypothetical protein
MTLEHPLMSIGFNPFAFTSFQGDPSPVALGVLWLENSGAELRGFQASAGNVDKNLRHRRSLLERGDAAMVDRDREDALKHGGLLIKCFRIVGFVPQRASLSGGVKDFPWS